MGFDLKDLKYIYEHVDNESFVVDIDNVEYKKSELINKSINDDEFFKKYKNIFLNTKLKIFSESIFSDRGLDLMNDEYLDDLKLVVRDYLMRNKKDILIYK